MQENNNEFINEDFQSNIQIKKIKLFAELESKNKNYIDQNKNQNQNQNKSSSSKEKKIKEKCTFQHLTPDEINFENFPIQNLFPVPFLKCVNNFNFISRNERVIFIDFTIEKKWVEILLKQVKYLEKGIVNNSISNSQNKKKINVDITEYQNSKIYLFYYDNESFRLTFSENDTGVDENASIMCGIEYLIKKQETTTAIPNNKIKRGFFYKIFKRWKL